MADLRIAVEIAARDLASDAIRGVEGALGGLGKASVAAKQLLPGVAAATAGLGAALGVAIDQAAGFEKTMSGVKAVMSPDEVHQFGGALEELALRLGKETAFSAKEAAAGLEELVKGGLSATDIMNGAAESTLALAAAGGVSLPDAATIAANALAQFSLKGEDMAHVADLIAGAANASAIDVGQFKFSLQAAGAVASTVGFSFDDLSQAIAVMGKAGIAGSDAGTSLKTMMLNLQPSTKAQTAEFQRLGLVGLDTAGIFGALASKIEENAKANARWETHVKEGTDTLENMHKVAQDFGIVQDDIDFNKWAFDAGFMGNQFFDASGKVKSMADVAEILQGAMEGMTEQQRLASLEILFGSDAIRAGAVLAKEGAEGFNEMAAAMGKVSATEVAEKRLDNLAGSMEQLQGSMETAAIVLGQQLIPLVRPLIDGVTGLINGFLGLDPNLQKFIAVGLVVATGIGAITTVALGLLAVLPAVISGFAAAATIAGVVGAVLTGPLLLAIGLVAGAIALLAVAWTDNWFDIQGKTEAVWTFLSEQVFTPLAATFAAFTTEILPEAAAAWTNMTATAQTVWKALMDFFTPLWNEFKNDWMTAWPAIEAILKVAWEAIELVVRLTWNSVETIVRTGLKVLQGDWAGAWLEVQNGLTRAWEAIKATVGGGLQQIAEMFVGFAGQAWEHAKEIGHQFVEGLVNGLREWIGKIKIDVGPFHLSASGFSIDAPQMPQISLPSFGGPAASTGGGAPGAPLRPGGKPGETASEVANFLENERRAAAGRGAGVPIVGGDLGASPKAEHAIAWAMGNLGAQAWNWLCQKFVENAFGTGGRFSSAKAAADALMTNRGGTPPRGALTFFAPDATNQFFGHVGISLGEGKFVSATASGVRVEDLAGGYWGRLYQGFGPPAFANGVRDFGGGLALVGEAGPEMVALPPGSDVYSNRESRAMLGIDYDRLAQAIAREVAGVSLSVSVDDIIAGIRRRQTGMATLGFR